MQRKRIEKLHGLKMMRRHGVYYMNGALAKAGIAIGDHFSIYVIEDGHRKYLEIRKWKEAGKW